MTSGLALDVRLALRSLVRARSLSIPAVLSLALAIGANASVFSLVNALLLRPLPVADPARLMSVTSDFAISHGFPAGAGWNYVMWEALRQRAGAFGGVLAWQGRRFTIGSAGDAAVVDGIYASGEFFATLGIRAQVGRVFTVEDDRDARAVSVISHRLWLQRFGGAADAIGSRMIVDGVETTVIGVAPSSFLGLEVGRVADIILPIGAEPIIRGGNAGLQSGRAHLLLIMLRLLPGQTPGSATATLRALQPEIVPARAPQMVKEPFVLTPADGTASGPASPRHAFRRPALVMLGGVALVLVIACVNITNLLLARSIARRRELGVRVAIGASRWRVVRPLLVESLLIAAAGGALGLTAAAWGARALLSLSPAVVDLAVDWRVAGFTAAMTALTAMIIGVVPSARAARASTVDLLRTTVGLSPQRGRLANGLVALQIALAVVVVVTAGLFVRTLAELAGRRLGFDADRVLILDAGLARVPSDPAARLQLFHQLADAARAVPGVEAAAASVWTPLHGEGGSVGVRTSRTDNQSVNVLANFVTPGWFATYGTPLLAGRDFGLQDSASSTRVVIVNQAFAKRFLPDANAVGADIDSSTVVGIVGDALYRTTQLIPGVTSFALREPVPPTLYVPLAQLPLWDRPPLSGIRVSVRTAGGSPLAVARSAAVALARVEPRLLLESRPLSDDVRASLAQERMTAAAASFFAGFALLLAVLGIYGVTSYGVSRRTSEIGVRMALGATRADVVRLITGGALAIAAIGVVAGLTGAAALTRFVSSLLYGVTPLDPLTLVLVSLVLLLTTALAALIPARRASRIDPWLSLRAE